MAGLAAYGWWRQERVDAEALRLQLAQTKRDLDEARMRSVGDALAAAQRQANTGVRHPRSPGGAIAPTQKAVPEGGPGVRPPSEEKAVFRTYLEGRYDRAADELGLDPRDREVVIDLLEKIRELRAGRGDAAPGTDAFADAQYEFIERTGMSVGEFLMALETAQPPRPGAPALPLRPGQARPPSEGAERKYFQDELSRQLGVKEPGSVERLDEHGEWTGE